MARNAVSNILGGNMKAVHVVSAIFLTMVSYGQSCLADGTVDFQQRVLPIIKQRPFFADFLLQTFEFESSAVGVTIGGNVSPQLGLARIGPYHVCAKRRGDAQSGSCAMVVVIDTDVHFRDKSGKEVDDPAHAQSVTEDFYAIEVNPPEN